MATGKVRLIRLFCRSKPINYIHSFRSLKMSNQTHSSGCHLCGQDLQRMIKQITNNCTFPNRKEAKYVQSITLQKQNILAVFAKAFMA